MNTEERKQVIADIKEYVYKFDEKHLGIGYFVNEMNCGECEHHWVYIDKYGVSKEEDCSSNILFTPFENICDVDLEDVFSNLKEKYGALN